MTIFTFYDESGHVITAECAADDEFPHRLAEVLRINRMRVYVTKRTLTPLEEMEPVRAEA